MSIISTLQSLRRGGFLDALDGEFRELVTAVRDTRRKGAITIKLAVTPTSPNDEDDITLEVVDTISTTLPRASPGRTIMFAAADGVLTRQDPRQLDMLREVQARAEKA